MYVRCLSEVHEYENYNNKGASLVLVKRGTWSTNHYESFVYYRNKNPQYYQTILNRINIARQYGVRIEVLNLVEWDTVDRYNYTIIQSRYLVIIDYELEDGENVIQSVGLRKITVPNRERPNFYDFPW